MITINVSNTDDRVNLLEKSSTILFDTKQSYCYLYLHHNVYIPNIKQNWEILQFSIQMSSSEMDIQSIKKTVLIVKSSKL